MANSIRSSSNIYVVQGTPKNKKELFVTQVIYGDAYKVGQRFQTKDNYDTSTAYVQCQEDYSKNGHALFFDHYSPVDIPEIYWLLKGDSVVHNDQEALSAILGLSNEYSSAGLEYCIQHYDRLLPLLLQKADSLNQRKQNNTAEYYGWRIANLHKVIFSELHKNSETYADKWLSRYAADTASIEFPGFLYFPEESFFLSLLTNTPKSNKYFEKKLRTLIPTLGERNLSTVYYVLLKSGCTDVYALEKEILPTQYEAYAVALYNFNSPYNRPHTRDKAQEYYQFMLKYAENPKLIEEIKQEIKT